MFSCCSELNETPIFCLEQVDLSSCLLLLEEKLAKKKKNHLLNGKSLPVSQAELCMHECVCTAMRTPLAKVEMMTETRERSHWLSHLGHLQDSCMCSHGKWVLRSLWSVLKSEFEAAPGCRERLLGAAVGAALPAVPHPCWGQCWA